jgi:hypothetical protein
MVSLCQGLDSASHESAFNSHVVIQLQIKPCILPKARATRSTANAEDVHDCRAAQMTVAARAPHLCIQLFSHGADPRFSCLTLLQLLVEPFLEVYYV